MSMSTSGLTTGVNTIATGITSGTLTWEFARCAHVTGEIVEYLDGKVFSNCVNCDERIEIGRVPGGLHLPRIALLVSRICDEGRNSDHHGEMLAELSEIRRGIEDQRQALGEAENLTMLAERLLRERM